MCTAKIHQRWCVIVECRDCPFYREDNNNETQKSGNNEKKQETNQRVVQRNA